MTKKKEKGYIPSMSVPVSSSIPKRMNALRQLLEGLVSVNIDFLERHKKLTGKSHPSLYEAAPKYRKADFGVWQDMPSVMNAGAGDACDLVCWRIAELRHEGYEDVHPYMEMTYLEDGSTITQVRVRINDLIEDPVVLLESAS